MSKLKNISSGFVAIIFIIVIGIFYSCQDASAEYKGKYEMQVQINDSLKIKSGELLKNLNTLFNVVDSLKKLNSNMQTSINRLNSKIDSLDIFYADMADAVTAQDTLLTYINNSVLNYIKKLRIEN